MAAKHWEIAMYNINKTWLAFGIIFLITTGFRSNSEFVVVNISYNVEIDQVERWKGKEHKKLERFGVDQFKDEFFQFDLNNPLKAALIFKIKAQDQNGIYPFYDTRTPFINYWAGVIEEDPRDIERGFMVGAEDNTFVFVPKEEIGPVNFKGTWEEAKTIISKAKKFKNTDVVLVLSHDGFEYRFKYKVKDVIIETK